MPSRVRAFSRYISARYALPGVAVHSLAAKRRSAGALLVTAAPGCRTRFHASIAPLMIVGLELGQGVGRNAEPPNGGASWMSPFVSMERLSWGEAKTLLSQTCICSPSRWLYVVVLMAVAEGSAPGGSWLGAAFTFLLYGVLPLGIALYLLGTPARRRARRRAELGSAGDRAAARSRRRRPSGR